MEGCESSIRVPKTATGAYRCLFQNFSHLRCWVRLPPSPQLQPHNRSLHIFRIIVAILRPKLAQAWVYEHGIRTLEEVSKMPLNRAQKLGLKYYDALQKKIPRDEMLVWEQILKDTVKEVNPDIYVEICGSLYAPFFTTTTLLLRFSWLN
jgi:hypothetical protein